MDADKLRAQLQEAQALGGPVVKRFYSEADALYAYITITSVDAHDSAHGIISRFDAHLRDYIHPKWQINDRITINPSDLED